MDDKLKEYTYAVRGMHCASCEILIEKKLLALPQIKSADASTAKGQVIIAYEGQKPWANQLSKLFEKDKYFFSETSAKTQSNSPSIGVLTSLVIAAVIIAVFILLNRFGLSKLINVNSSSSLPTFFIFGLLAGVSSCAALVGGIILSMSKQWTALYSTNDSFLIKSRPHVMFNIGRLFSYFILGGVLGLIGQKLQLSITFSSVLVMAISVVMVFLALQMIGLKYFRRFQFTLPKSMTRYIADTSNFKGRWMPVVMGALTFFLPCGFTLTAQGMALLSGSFFQGGIIMFFFALGTLFPLLTIGLTSVKFSSSHHLSTQFLKVAGIVVLFFAVFNINAQLNVLGFGGLDKLFSSPPSTNAQNQPNDLPPIVEGKQIVKMDASVAGYSPRNIKVRVGVPVRWEINDTGTSGCTNAIISRNLFAGQIDLKPGQISIKEFTPQKIGQYGFSCWMGMVTGTIEVVNYNS
jgi:sulfite exporter TauE/SafE/copper chaperone CopZ